MEMFVLKEIVQRISISHEDKVIKKARQWNISNLLSCLLSVLDNQKKRNLIFQFYMPKNPSSTQELYVPT